MKKCLKREDFFQVRSQELPLPAIRISSFLPSTSLGYRGGSLYRYVLRSRCSQSTSRTRPWTTSGRSSWRCWLTSRFRPSTTSSSSKRPGTATRASLLRPSGVVRDSNLGHQQLLAPAEWCPCLRIGPPRDQHVYEVATVYPAIEECIRQAHDSQKSSRSSYVDASSEVCTPTLRLSPGAAGCGRGVCVCVYGGGSGLWFQLSHSSRLPSLSSVSSALPACPRAPDPPGTQSERGTAAYKVEKRACNEFASHRVCVFSVCVFCVYPLSKPFASLRPARA